MFYNSKKKSFGLLCILVITSVCVYPEFLLYKKGSQNPDGIDPIGYSSLSDTQKKEVIHLYHQTIRTYAPPFACANAETLSKDPEYMLAVQAEYGLLTFLQKKADELSHGTYGIVWIPTILYEIIALHYFDNAMNIVEDLEVYISDMPRKKYSSDPFGQMKFDLNNTLDPIPDFYMQEPENPLNKKLWQVLQKEFFTINDRALKLYRDQHTVYIQNPVFSDKMRTLIEELSVGLNHGTSVIRYGARTRIHNPLLSPKALPIIYNIIPLELEALRNNNILLIRGTQTITKNGTSYIDYNFGKNKNLSYGYSLCAGTYFDRDLGRGARALDYTTNFTIGYVVLISLYTYITDYKKYNEFFLMPPLSTLEGLLSQGEYFHPRFRIVDTALRKYNQFEATQFFGTILKNAKIISKNNAFDRSQHTTQKEILQEHEACFAESQARFVLEQEMVAEQYDIVKELLLAHQKYGTKPTISQLDFLIDMLSNLQDEDDILVYSIPHMNTSQKLRIYNQFEHLPKNIQRILIKQAPLESLGSEFRSWLPSHIVRLYQETKMNLTAADDDDFIP